jgi:hypothetical protein
MKTFPPGCRRRGKRILSIVTKLADFLLWEAN